jgi:hypothetical protein
MLLRIEPDNAQQTFGGAFSKNFRQVYNVPAKQTFGGKYLPYGLRGDLYDVFPQFLEYLIKNSGTLLKTITRKAKFLYGNGFEDVEFGDGIVNSKNETANELLWQTCFQQVAYENASWWIGYNGIGKIAEVQAMRYAKVRIGEPTEQDEILYYAYTHQYDKYYTKKHNLVQYFHAFNPSPLVVMNQIKQAGGIIRNKNGGLTNCHKGQILYFWNSDAFSDFYTFPTWASVMQDAENEAIIASAKKDDIEDRFKPQVNITKFGTNDPTEEQRARDEATYGQTVGTGGSRFMLDYAINQESKPAIDVIETPDLSRAYEYAEKSIQRNIESVFGIPQELLSFSDKTDFLGDSEKIKRLLDLFQKTELNPIQTRISRKFEEVFQHFPNTNKTGNYKIQNLSII